jgi:hypothetical protein
VIWLILLMTVVACSSGLEEGGRALRSAAAPSRTTASPTPVDTSPAPSLEAPQEGPAIRVERPRPRTEVLSPALVRGTALTASGRVAVRILDAGGMELAAINVEVGCGAGCQGGFEARLAFFVPSASRGTVQVFEPAPDGEVRGLVEVPVTLVPGV